MTNLIREYLRTLPEALLTCQVKEYTVKLEGEIVTVTVTKRDGVKHRHVLDPENVEKYEKGLQDWWAVITGEKL